jgi:hypothetical protein
MLDLMIVQETLKSSWTPEVPADDQDSSISLLIHDFFGGEILKTPKKKGWHFYNRIDGLRIDFTSSQRNKNYSEKRFKDIPATPDETYRYVSEEDYSSFLMRFIRTFEETVGLKRWQPEQMV